MKLSSLTVEQFANLSFDCACGETHRVETRHNCVGRRALDRLPDVLGELGGESLLIVTAKDVEPLLKPLEETLRKIRRVTVHCYPAGFTPSLLSVSELAKYRADAVLCFGSGSVGDAAKYHCSVTGAPLVTVLTAPVADLSDTSNLLCAGRPEKFAAVPPAAVFADFDLLKTAPSGHAASALGWMAASALSLFEWKLSKLLAGRSYCEEISAFSLGLVERAVEAGERYAAGNREAVCDLATCLIEQGACDQMLGCARATEGSATLTAAVMKLMNEPIGGGALLGERALLAANRLLPLFEECLLGGTPMPVLPTDKVRRASLAAAYCGGDADAILRKLYDAPKLNLALAKYLIAENRGEIADGLAKTRRLLVRANRVFKHMYPDGGYWLKSLKIPQMRTAVYLAPDLSGGFTVLGLLRDAGILEKIAEEC